jgi:hypothetical protein
MRLNRLINLLNNRRRAVRTNLRKSPQLAGIKPQRNHRIPASTLRLGHDPANRIVPRSVQLFSSASASQ